MSMDGMEQKKYEFIEKRKQIKVQGNIKIIIYEKLKLFLFKKNINCIENIFIFSFIILYDFYLIESIFLELINSAPIYKK